MKKRFACHFFSLPIINGLLFILMIILGSLFFIAPADITNATKSNLCAQPADVVLLMDRSGSMDYTSRCDWWQLKCNNPPSCSSGYTWVKNTTYNQTQAWCAAKNQSAPHQSTFLAINPKKIVAAKQAADNFVALMGNADQSALVSYASSATLDRILSNDHTATQNAINSLIPNGATNIGDAIKLGTQELSSARANAQALKAMILLTDGMANKPSGPGYGEWPADVAYAQNQAVIAADLGFKIYTIGLGDNGEINEVMLQNIASTTGAVYYHSPTQNDLEAIYKSIATRLCRFGSISGCKYSDANKDGNITGEEKISGWEIKLNHDENLSQLTDDTGCYKFSGLLPGTYTVSEGGKAGVAYEQTYPAGGSYTINLLEGENLVNKDFGNYLPVCGNDFVDTAYGEVCEIGDSKECTANLGYKGRQSCKTDCSDWDQCIPTEYCGDGIVNDSEECDGQAGVGPNQSCAANCTLADSGYCGDGIVNGDEECDDANTNNEDECKNNCRFPGCRADVDMMMVLDRSGSMGYSSACVWWQLKCINPPSCSGGYTWVKNTTYNQTQAWCDGKNKSTPHQSVWIDYTPIKIVAAKFAANNFLDQLGVDDQSGLVSYANDATLDKLLSNNHGATKIAVNALLTNGATDIGDAISLATTELLSGRAKLSAKKVMILLTDGMANKPYGPGYGENPADVAYALAKAGEAAAAGINIYTIGLGADGDINEVMLQAIALNSGGEYYHAPTASELEAIFYEIADVSCTGIN